MSFLERLFPKRKAAVTTSQDLERVLQSGTGSNTGLTITPDTALRVTAVYAAVRLLSESMGQLPLILYRRRRGQRGKDRAVDHPLYRLLHAKPNRFQTSFAWREFMQNSIGLRGNAYSFKNRAGGAIRELVPIHPQRVKVTQDPTTLDLRFTVSAISGGAQSVLTLDDVLYIPGFGTDGITGLSPISLFRETVALAMAGETAGAKMFGNGLLTSGTLEHPNALSDGAFEHLKESLRDSFGGVSSSSAFSALILEEGMKWNKISMSAEDAQFIESRKFQLNEIARIYRVPPHMIGDLERATFSNIEHQQIEFVVHSLGPWIVRWEQALNASLLTDVEQEEFFFEFLVDALLRGDTKTRFEAYNLAAGGNAPWLTRNEIRLAENRNEEPGLDEFLVPANMTTVSDDAARRDDGGNAQAFQRSNVLRWTPGETR